MEEKDFQQRIQKIEALVRRTETLADAEARGRIEYREQGDGPVLVLVPGSFSTGAAWKGVAQALGRPWRIVRTSLSGYGETDERRDAAAGRPGSRVRWASFSGDGASPGI